MTKSHLVAWGLLVALGGWLFAPALSAANSFAYRDSAHFYHPLFDYTRGQWGAGRVPLWNPHENLGMPLAGDSTSSVFYPGKLLFVLPLDYTLLFNLYVVAHVALAAAGTFWLARYSRASVQAATLAAAAYAFSGNVLFQYCNVVFLVGAAWLPLALLATGVALRRGSGRAAVALGAIWALMITGGDPQMAYNAALLAVLDAVLPWRSKGDLSRSDTAESRIARLPAAISRLSIAAAACLLVGAIQIFPSAEATRHSTRALYDAPRNIYELATAAGHRLLHGDAQRSVSLAGLLGRDAGEHGRGIYQFNVGPWRAIECLWPNVSGNAFPTYHRWLDVAPAEGRVWTPSLYMGLLPMVLAAWSFRLRAGAPADVRRWSWMALLSAAAGCGAFGLVWLIREVAGWFGATALGDVGDEVGGLYWLMTVVLPGYVYFRYPAKLLVVTTLALSLLAACGWDRAWQQRAAGPRRTLAALAAVSLLLLIGVGAAWQSIAPRLAALPPNDMFGPFDLDAAWLAVRRSLLQTCVLGTLLAWLLKGPLPPHGVPRWAPTVCLLVVAADLAVAQAPLIAMAPAAAWTDPPIALTSRPADEPVGDARANEAPAALFAGDRTYRDPRCWPPNWRTARSEQRMAEGVAWERASRRAKYNLPLATPLVSSTSTMTPYDIRAFWQAARERAVRHNGLPDASILRLCGVRTVLAATRQDGGALPGVQVRTIDGSYPRAWIVHQVEVTAELHNPTPRQLRARTEHVLFPGGRQRDWLREAVVETDRPVPRIFEPDGPRSDESCRIVSDEPHRVEVAARLASTGLVVLADSYAPGWRLTVHTDGQAHAVPLLRANRVLRGAVLPAGEHRLVYEYRPASARWGAALSGLAVLVLLAWGAAQLR